MKRVSLPIVVERKTKNLHPIVLQTIQYLGARAEDTGFFSKEDVEKSLTENRVGVEHKFGKVHIVYKNARGLTISKSFKFPKEERHGEA